MAMRNSFGVIVVTLALAACGGSADEENVSPDEPAVVEGMTSTAVQVDTAPPPAITTPPTGDPIRGPGGLEEKCLSRVNEQVGGAVVGTNRIEEAESGVMIYINVEGATAPWQCFGYRDGTIEEIFFGGDEGAL